MNDERESIIKHTGNCSQLQPPRYELFAGVLVSRCPECDRGVPHPKTLSAADVKDRNYGEDE